VEPTTVLADRQWQVIDQLGDLLAEEVDPFSGLVKGIQLITETMNRPGAALYLPVPALQKQSGWCFWNIPDPWKDELKMDGSRFEDLAARVILSERVAKGDPSHEIAAVFPVCTSKRTVGALIVYGEKISEEDFPGWEALLKPIGRSALFYTHAATHLAQSPAYLDLLKSRNTLRAMFDNVPLSIYIIDQKYQLIAVNNSRSARAKEEPKMLVGRICYEKFYNRTSVCPNCRAGETLVTGLTTQRFHREWLDREKFLETEVNTFPIYDDGDRIIQATIIEIDVTEKRNLEVNLIQSEKLAAVGQLAAGVAHEINNPLTAIIANAQLLRREIPADEVDMLDSLKLIELAGTRAAQVVRNLLGIARKEKYEFLPVDLNETLRNSISLVQHELIGKPIEVQLNLQDGMPEIIASQDQLQGVWINLILNAIDALDKENGIITISSNFTGSNYQIAVQDNGKGIAQEHIARVFEPFYTTKSAGRGTGLGLSVCMRAINHHNGTIQVDSELGNWTRFTVIIPGPR
jgi:signal transduction histidine kinase